jgi:hypothetical protein
VNEQGKSQERNNSDEGQDEHESRQRNVGQLILIPNSPEGRTEVNEQGKSQERSNSHEGQDEHESRQRTVGQLILSFPKTAQKAGQK